MASTTGRMALHFPQPADSNNVPQDLQTLATQLDLLCVTFLQGVANARPVSTAPTGIPAQGNYNPGTQGRWYWATDTSTLSYDYGGDWFTIPSVFSLLKSRGDLLVAQGNAAAARLAAGGDGQTLVARSGSPLGLNWETQLGMPLGLPGAAAPTRYVGATSTSGPPSSGTFLAGDHVISVGSGSVWVCTVGGTPGTWVEATPSSPAFCATNGGPTINNYYWYTVTGWYSTGVDTNSAITSSGYVIPKAGVWEFFYNLPFNPNSYYSRFGRLCRNGDPAWNSPQGSAPTFASNTGPTSDGPATVSLGLIAPTRLAIGDVISVQASQDSGRPLGLYTDVCSGPMFSGRWIRP